MKAKQVGYISIILKKVLFYSYKLMYSSLKLLLLIFDIFYHYEVIFLYFCLPVIVCPPHLANIFLLEDKLYLDFQKMLSGSTTHICSPDIQLLTDIYPPVGRLNVTRVSRTQTLDSIRNNTQLIQLLFVKTEPRLTISSIIMFEVRMRRCLISV